MNEGLIKIKEETQRCLNCKNRPCSDKGCPLNNDIPEFIKLVKEENYKEAYNILTKTTVLPSICGRICPHDKQCQGSCIRGIKGTAVNIGEIEAFVGDMAIKNNYEIYKFEKQDLKGKNVAIVGGGPAGITASAFFARRGANVTIYERYDFLGGLLIYGIPEFRLSKELVKKSISKILELGIDVKYNKELGKNLNLEELEKNYDNIVLAFGANVSIKLGVPGENLKGVFGANELLEYNLHPNYMGKTVIVNGGGNVALDVARTVKKLGAKKVIIIYRRQMEQMPAEKKEIECAINEKIEFLFQHNIVKIIGDNNDIARKVEVIKTELIQKDGEKRLFPIDIKGSNYEINADYIITAIGSHIDNFARKLDLSNPKISVIGDLAEKNKTVAWAAKSGRDIALK